METIVYITSRSEVSLPLTCFAIRTGLLISDTTFAVGNAYTFILYEEILTQYHSNPSRKLRFLQRDPDFIAAGFDGDQMLRDLKLFWERRRDPKALKLYKTLERIVNNMFDESTQKSLTLLRAVGMLQLAPLKSSPELVVLGLEEELGEVYPDGFRISNVLTLKRESDEDSGPYVHILIAQLAVLSPEDESNLVHLFDLPNINVLTLEQLMAVRKDLAPHMKALHDLLTPDPDTTEDYASGIWDRTRMAEVATSLQQAINRHPEILWAIGLGHNYKASVLAGQMDMQRFWQLQRECHQVPDDSWQVLNSLPSETPYPRTVPVIVIRTAYTSDPTDSVDVDSVSHKRRTISLD
jgi:hypothetical protein